MSTGEVIHESSTGAKKAGNLERYDLIPALPYAMLAHFYRSEHRPEPSFDRLAHHLWSFWDGISTDDETGHRNLVLVAYHATELICDEIDDRWVALPDARGFDRIPPEAIRLLARHYGRGSLKYAANNWRYGYDWGLSFAALNRHLEQHRAGQPVDEETGSLHLTAVLWHAFTLLAFGFEHPDFDSRWRTECAA